MTTTLVADARRRLGLVAISLAFLMVTLDATVVNVALTAIRGELGGTLATLQWVVNAYTVAFATLLLTFGSVADRIGTRRVFLGGLALFGLGSALCAGAPDAGVLIAARIVQGAGAAALMPCSLALIVHRYAPGAERARALGVWGGMSGIGLALGPPVGGLLTAALGWRAVFVVNLPVGALAWALIQKYVSEVPRRESEGTDRLGQALGAGALASLSAGLIEAGARGWGDGLADGLLMCAALGGAAFLLTEVRARSPMLPLSLLRSHRYSAACAIGLLFNLNLYGSLFCLALFLGQVHRLSPLDVGLALLPFTATVGMNAFAGGRWIARAGPRRPMQVGTLAGGCGAAALATCSPSTPLAVVVVAAVVLGGCALTMPAMTAVAMSAAPSGRTGLASGVLNAARQTGGALGVALLGSLLALPGHHRLDLAAPMVVVAGAYLIAFVLTIPATPAGS